MKTYCLNYINDIALPRYMYKEAKEGRVYLVSDCVILRHKNVYLLSLIIPNPVNVQFVVKKCTTPKNSF